MSRLLHRDAAAAARQLRQLDLCVTLSVGTNRGGGQKDNSHEPDFSKGRSTRTWSAVRHRSSPHLHLLACSLSSPHLERARREVVSLDGQREDTFVAFGPVIGHHNTYLRIMKKIGGLEPPIKKVGNLDTEWRARHEIPTEGIFFSCSIELILPDREITSRGN